MTTRLKGGTWLCATNARFAVIARSASDEAIHPSVGGDVDCFASLAMTVASATPCNCGFARRAIRWQKSPQENDARSHQACTGGQMLTQQPPPAILRPSPQPDL